MYLTNNYVKCIIDIIIVCVLWISLFCIYYKYNFSFWDYKYYYFIFGKLLEKQQINVKMIMRFYSNYKMKSNFKFNLIISIFLPTSCWQLMTDLTRQVEGRHSNYTFWVSLGCLLLHWSNSFEISFMMLFYWIRSLCCIKFPIETFFV